MGSVATGHAAGPVAAGAASFGLIAAGIGSLVLIGLGLTLMIRRRRRKKRLRKARRSYEKMRRALGEAEALLTAEPQLLYVWRGKGDAPYRLIGDLRGVPGVPESKADRLDFSSWLDPPSLARLSAANTQLRSVGTSFNLSVTTLEGGLLEADGRAAGGMATLRLRTVEGERLAQAQAVASSHDLRRLNDGLTGLLDALPTPIWQRGEDGTLVWVNRAYARAVQAEDPAQAVARGCELAPGVAASGDGDGSAIRTVDCVISGERRTLDLVQAPGGSGHAGVAIDVTAREQARKDLDLHISAHSSTLRRLATAVAIFDREQRLKFFNPAYVSLWRLDPAWLETEPSDGEILERLRDRQMLEERVDFASWKAGWLDAYTSLKPHDVLWHPPDRRTIKVNVQQHPSGGLTYLYEDVTERYELESSYKLLIRVQQETLARLDEAVALFGSDGRLKLYNPAYARIWLLDPAVLDKEPHVSDIVELCRPLYADNAAWDDLKWAVTALECERHDLNATLTRTDDTVLRFSAVPLPDGATLLAYVDITDSTKVEHALRARNEALKDAEHRKANFVSDMSHNLRIPLTNISGFAELLEMGLAGPLSDRQRGYVADILRSSSDLEAIVNNILDLATIDADIMEFKREPVDLKDVMNSAARMLKPKLLKKSMRMQMAVPRNIEPLLADGAKIRQILYNLLSNAIAFSPNGSQIKIGCRRQDDRMCLWVSDCGRGIAPDEQSAVFERFRSRTRGNEQRRVGLGLAVVKSFMELHGGSVELHSKQGEGTTVECLFPIIEQTDRSDQPEHQPASGQSGEAAATARPAAGHKAA